MRTTRCLDQTRLAHRSVAVTSPLPKVENRENTPDRRLKRTSRLLFEAPEARGLALDLFIPNKKGIHNGCPSFVDNIGGAEGDRTPDLMTASHALSQLSYGPKESKSNVRLEKRSSEGLLIADCQLAIDVGSRGWTRPKRTL